MKLKFKKLGYIEGGVEVSPGNLTIIAGDNNTGKTFISYTLYGLYRNLLIYLYEFFEKKIDNLLDDKLSGFYILLDKEFIEEISSYLNKRLKEDLPEIFSSSKEFFADTEVLIDVDFTEILEKKIYNVFDLQYTGQIIIEKLENSTQLNLRFDNVELEADDNMDRDTLMVLAASQINYLIMKNIPTPFVITSERTGVSLFYKELDINKNKLIDKIAKDREIDVANLLFQNLSRYPITIKQNIDITRDIWNFNKQESFLVSEEKEKFIEIINKLSNMLNGEFKIEEDQIFFIPKKENNRKQVKPVPLYLSSSSVKSFLLLYVYIKSIAKKNDILMIDEPELNLHPSNQIQMARLLANLVNMGIDVLITTHSDYLVKELNNLIMLSNDFEDKEEIKKKYAYTDLDILSPEKVKAYYIEEHKIKEAKIDNFGIDYEIFDDTITKFNQISNDIYYSVKE